MVEQLLLVTFSNEFTHTQAYLVGLIRFTNVFRPYTTLNTEHSIHKTLVFVIGSLFIQVKVFLSILTSIQ